MLPSGGATAGRCRLESPSIYLDNTLSPSTYDTTGCDDTKTDPFALNLHGASFGGMSLDDVIASCRLPIPASSDGTDQAASSGASFLSDRLSVESFATSDLVRRIRDRLSFYRLHMDELDQARINAVAVRRDWRSPLDSQPYLADPELLRDVQRIDGEKRAERLSLWRDLGDLRSKLPEQWASYLSSYRRHHLLAPLKGMEQQAASTTRQLYVPQAGPGTARRGDWDA